MGFKREDVWKQVLDPDNPLLLKFQQTLKEHLLRQIKHLKEEIFEYETEAKKNEQKKEEIGKNLYEEQQIIRKQESILENLMDELTITKRATQEMDEILKEKKQLYKAERNRLFEAKAEEEETRRELENLNYFIWQITEWEKRLEGDLATKQTIADKSRKEKMQFIDEKKFQDALIYKLMTRIWQLEKDLNEMDVQLRVQSEEREDMAEAVCEGDANLEALQSEYRALRFSWNAVITNIGCKDKRLNCLQKEMTNLHYKFKTTMTEIEKVKKESQKEMEKNEHLTLVKATLLKDIKNAETVRDQELSRKDSLDKQMEELAAVTAQIESDINNVLAQQKKISVILDKLTLESKELTARKMQMEEQILKKLEEEISNNKLAMTVNKQLRELRDRNQALETQLSIMENKTSKALTDVETQKCVNEELKKLHQEVEYQLNDLVKEGNLLDDTIKKCIALSTRRQREQDIATLKYQKVLEATGGKIVTPLELRINELERSIVAIEEENQKLQIVWLREQSHIVDLSEERQEQIRKHNILSKQILLMEQKNFRITNELEQYKKKAEIVRRNITALYNRLKILCDHVFQKRDRKEALCSNNDFARSDYIIKLQDAEMECLKLKEEISQIEEDKKLLNQDIININRDILEWEKKYKLAKECKDNINKEKGTAGEFGSMKAEVHRMEVRYSQLMKAQDQLVKDLEHCVNRRDFIFDGAQARERRSKGGMEKTRFNFQRKLDDTKNKILQISTEIETVKQQTEVIEREQNFACRNTEIIEVELAAITDRITEILEEIEKLTTKRQMDFELLVKLQKKLGMYTELHKGKKPFTIYRTEAVLTDEYWKQKDLNKNLSELVETLMSEFPQLSHKLERVMNTLKVSALINF